MPFPSFAETSARFAYITLAAVYRLGRTEEADRIPFPLLEAFAKGSFQGRGANGMSNDWRAWDGTCWGYEGFLADNYYALLAVLDRQAALKRAATSKSGAGERRVGHRARAGPDQSYV